jgi:hypothetical protein
MNIRLARAVFLFLLAMSLAFALRETLMVLSSPVKWVKRPTPVVA